jgi:hypothetical protein
LEAAATLKQDGYSPLLHAFDFYTKQGWVIHVFPWVVGIRGLLHPPHTCAALQFLEVPHQHWPLAVESAVLASVNAFYFLHRVRFGGPSECGRCATGRDCAEQELDASDSSDLEELRACTGKCGSPWSSGAGAIPQRAPKRLKRSSQTTAYQLRVLLISAAGSAQSRVPDISPPSCLAGHGMGEILAGHGMGERQQDVPQRFASLRSAHWGWHAWSIRNVRPPPLMSSQNHRLGTQAHWQCPRNGRSSQANRL